MTKKIVFDEINNFKIARQAREDNQRSPPAKSMIFKITGQICENNERRDFVEINLLGSLNRFAKIMEDRLWRGQRF